jgi:2-iminoacetate synthase
MLRTTKRCIPSILFRRTSPLFVQKRFARWSVEKETNVKLPDASTIINEQQIHELLNSTKSLAKDHQHVKKVLERARNSALLKSKNRDPCEPQTEFVQGLSLEDTATLLNVDENNREIMNSLYTTALYIKELIYGNRIVLFAPLYISNYCVGSCLYCGYRGENKTMKRSVLTKEQLIEEVKALERLGHKRIMMLTGESPKYTFENFLEALHTAASVKTEPHGEIRRINVEIPSLSISDFRRLKATNHVGTYVLFQETYHKDTFKIMHPYGPKSDYDYRLLTMDRAQIAGLDDVGIGALFGLYDYRFEVMGLLQHAQHLDKTYGAGPHTISIPRLRPADHAPMSSATDYIVSDEQFKKLVAIIRCAVPYTGMILTTRESPQMRRELLHVGISQMSAGSKVDVGSYQEGEEVHKDDVEGQFSLGDERPTHIVIRELIEMGYIPSWCTACYRMGRTGEKFMKIAKKGDIQNLCHPNAIMTLAEYLHDYADAETQRRGWELIEKEQLNIPSEQKRQSLKKNLEEIAKGARDLYY